VGRKDPKANIFKLVHNWLRDERKGKWRLILDNVDDHRVLYEALFLIQGGLESGQTGTSRQPLVADLPQSQNGSILMMLRSREVALRFLEPSDIITVDPMDKAHAVASAL
jgi:hypothetical protein